MNSAPVGSRVEHDRYGEGIISKVTVTSYEIFFERAGKMEILKSSDELSLKERNQEGKQETSSALSLEDMEKVICTVLDKYGMLQEVVEMGEKWEGGSIILKPGNTELQPKEIPIETFFHKIVMLRDRLRVLEQNINSHPKLSDEEKVNMQQYITRIYGSLTTFNVLFKDKNDFFVGSGGKKS